ncbi:uncharacterized protein N7500_004463 [Penicillium coprophilum]|uniref:uncharacterized protein n=1 Tax=Penicillium coprophilum TaxID=36646 RepID=UPI0023A14505|nr:uncharacterized protein N7500_004463 [Penicillium coprophilum]KAJ5162633.1 hypothetical protein N7500_004463 [Penicillium coprophilum]
MSMNLIIDVNNGQVRLNDIYLDKLKTFKTMTDMNSASFRNAEEPAPSDHRTRRHLLRRGRQGDWAVWTLDSKP